MLGRTRRFIVTGSPLALCLCCSGIMVPGSSSAGQQPAKPSFAAVNAVLQAKCVSCHNRKQHPEAVDVSGYAALMKSGEKGPIVIAHHPEKSKLLLYIDGTKQPRMPYKQQPLSKQEIATIRAWVKAGAKG